jgi:ELWxxDGT repeat protein
MSTRALPIVRRQAWLLVLMLTALTVVTSGPALAQTRLVKDINPASSSVPQGGVMFSGVLVFAADDGVTGLELWRSDGTAAGTSLLADICPGPCSSYPQSITLVGGPSYFSGGVLYFSADDGIHGAEPWRTNGTVSGTEMLADLNPGTNSSNPKSFVLFDGSVFFGATDATGSALWRTGGTSEGTVLAMRLPRGSTICAPITPEWLTTGNGFLFFVHGDCDRGRGYTILYYTNGSDLFGPLDYNVYSLRGGPAIPGAGSAVFYTTYYYPSGGPPQTSLMKTNGPVTVEIAAGPYGYDSLRGVAGLLFFRSGDPANGYELWKSDGTPAGTAIVKDINPGPNHSQPSSLTDVNGTLFFSAEDGVNGRELWKSDGTAAGTVMVRDIRSGPTGSDPSLLTPSGSEVFFSADDGVTGRELWKSDGTPFGTRLVEDIEAGPNWSAPDGIVPGPLGVFFTAYRGDIGAELFLLPTIPAYRLYSSLTFEHLYSTDPNEDRVLGQLGWTREGVAYRLFPNTTPYEGLNPIPLHRLYNGATRQHLWTTDSNEAAVLPSFGWTYEGIIGRLLPSPAKGAVPLYRMNLPDPPVHLWTSDDNEYAVLQTRGWIGEGMIGYVMP